jgi:hypothetical protein
MSMPVTERITCEKCNSVNDVTMWRSVNVALHPERKPELLAGRLTLFTCHSCGSQTQLLYPLLYHDMQQQVMIWLLPDLGETGPLPAGMPTGLPPWAGPAYRSRAVPDILDLIEKIRIFDAGLDDRIVEFLKAMIRMQAPAALRSSSVFFLEIAPDNQLAFVLPRSDGVATCRVARSRYDQAVALYEPALRRPLEPWARVDQTTTPQILEGDR